MNEYFNSMTLLKYSSLRKITFPLILANFISMFLFNAPSIIQKEENLVEGSIIFGISYILAVLITQVVLLNL